VSPQVPTPCTAHIDVYNSIQALLSAHMCGSGTEVRTLVPLTGYGSKHRFMAIIISRTSGTGGTPGTLVQ
jgi:hypothetical protein